MAIAGPLPPTYLLGSIVAMVAFNVLIPGPELVRFPWNLVGLAPFGLGVLLNLAADRSFKKRRTTVKPFEQPSALLTDGVFCWTRNPMYVGLVLILFGLGLFMGSVNPLVIVPVFALAMHVIFIRAEERAPGSSKRMTGRSGEPRRVFRDAQTGMTSSAPALG